ncbi:MAG: efflux RND transporter periplasmic adaptor subunit [Novosphingobium sp.]
MHHYRTLTGLACVLALTGCGGGKEERGKPSPPLVVADAPVRHRFVDVIEAVGTARANEQVTIASPVTERLERVLFDDGMAVHKGQLLAVLSQGQEDAQLQGAMAVETQATAQYHRIKSLADRGFATRAQLDQQVAMAEGARASAAEARAAIGDRMIRAPFAGYTSLRTISAGMVVTTGTPLVTISDLSRIKLDFTVPETRLQSLGVGQPITAIAAAFPDAPFTGTITSIDPVIDPSSRAVLVRATLPNPGARIKPGMLMTVRVSADDRLGDAVPELAVTGRGNERFVYVVTPEKKAKQVPVRTGLRDSGMIEVTGLPPGASVIGDGVIKVSDGMVVRLRGHKARGPQTASAD